MNSNTFKTIEHIVEAYSVAPINYKKEDIKVLKMYVDSYHTFKDTLDFIKFDYNSDDCLVEGYYVSPKELHNKAPVIIFNRGGFEEYGAISNKLVHLKLGYFASKGYIVIASNYRNKLHSKQSDEFGGKDVKDVLNLYSIIKQLPLADEARIGMYGESRGAMMTYMAIAEINWIKAAITVSGRNNLLLTETERPEMFEAITKRIGNNKEEWINRSAIFWPEKLTKVPLLLIHGLNDEKVQHSESENLYNALMNKNSNVQLLSLQQEGHTIINSPNVMLQKTIDWFNKYL